MSEFVHLRAHSSYSMEEGTISPEDLVAKAVEHGMGAVALTDLNRMFATVPFYKEARAQGVKPIVGVDFWIEPDVTQPGGPDQEPGKPVRAVLLSQSTEGYRRLMHLNSRAYVENQKKGQAAIKQSWLQEPGAIDDLILLSGDPLFGEIAQTLVGPYKASDAPSAEAVEAAQLQAAGTVAFYKTLFGDKFYLEVSRANQPFEAELVAATVALADATGTPLVATHPIVYANREDYYPHEVRISVARKEKVDEAARQSEFTREQYFLSGEEMEVLFQDLPDALQNAAEIAKRCSPIVPMGKYVLPEFQTPNGEPVNEFFRAQAQEGLEERLLKIFPDPAVRQAERAKYDERLAFELGVIEKMGFDGYYLIVSDFIKWSLANDIPVGAGRGSGAGSLVAYALKITNLDPLPLNLLFERFLNPDRVSMPDFDIDFEIERRDDVVDYVSRRYGRNSVSQIANINTAAGRSIIKDVVRTLGLNTFLGGKWASLVPEKSESLAQSLEEVPALREAYEGDVTFKRVLDLAMKLEGTPRAVGKHAAGVVMSPSHVADYSPLYTATEDGGGVVTQYDKDNVEAAGLVKFDFLGLKNLTVIQRAERLISARPERQGLSPFKIEDLSLDDPGAYETLSSGDTVSVFQLESGGMQGLLRSIQPRKFEDIIALISLYRPGPMDLIPTYEARSKGEEQVEYPDPRVEGVLKETYGVMVYQEQVMQMAQLVGGYTLGEADLLRRAMGKKKVEEMAKERVRFCDGAERNGMDRTKAEQIFNDMEKFAGYGFNKSHAAAYALLSYQTAYLKRHYPLEFFAAFLSTDAFRGAEVGELNKNVRDATKRGITFLMPDVNKSQLEFMPEDGAIRYSMVGIKGIGRPVVEKIIAVREEKGAFTSFQDFCEKIGSGINRANLEALIRSGAFDSLDPNRAQLIHNAKPFLDYANAKAKQAKDEGVLLGGVFKKAAAKPSKKKVTVEAPVFEEIEPWSSMETLNEERKTLGFFLSGHPFDGYAQELGSLRAALPLKDVTAVEPSKDHYHLLTGVIVDLRAITIKKAGANFGRKMAFVALSDGDTEQEITIFPDQFEPNQSWLKVGNFLGAKASISPKWNDPDTLGVDSEEIFSFGQLQSKLLRRVFLNVRREELPELEAVLLRHQAEPEAEGVAVTLCMPEDEERYFRLELKHLKLTPSPDVMADLKQHLGKERVAGEFAPTLVFPMRQRFTKTRRNKP